MSREAQGLLRLIREGRSSLGAVSECASECVSERVSDGLVEQLNFLDEFFSSRSASEGVSEERLIGVVRWLQSTSRERVREWLQHQHEHEEGSDVSTRVRNVSGWELAALAGLACAHYLARASTAPGPLPHSSTAHSSTAHSSTAHSSTAHSSTATGSTGSTGSSSIGTIAATATTPSSDCVDMYIDVVDFLLVHSEARSRACAATLVRALAKSFAAKTRHQADGTRSPGEDVAVRVYKRLYTIILQRVKEHLGNRETETRPVKLQGTGDAPQEELHLDDLSGWHNLETSYAAYKALIEGYGGRFTHLIDASPEAYDIFIGVAGAHLNRYVRQAACELIGVIGTCALSVLPQPHEVAAVSSSLMAITTKTESEVTSRSSGVYPLELFTRVLSDGMEDSWCQVRLAATQVAGVLLRWVKHLSSPESLGFHACTSLWTLLVPRLCLNRHYSTDSVRTAAHHAWRNITLHCSPTDLGGVVGGAGVLALRPVTAAVVAYYITMTKHKNHMVCEAACAAIAELGSRVDPDAVAQYLPQLCLSLRSALADTSWPIRDTAATAVGRFLRYNGIKLAPSYFRRSIDSHGTGPVASGAVEGMQEVVGDLLGLLFTCLREDPFRPVRESAAVGLVDICLHDNVELGCDVWWNIEKFIEDNILALCLQPGDVDSADTTEVAVASSMSTQVKKNIQFIPNKMLATMMKSSSSVSQTSATSDDAVKRPLKASIGRWLYSDWQEEPGDSMASRSSRRKKRKEMLAQRVSAGWGCCLDCGAGDNGQVAPSEVSRSCLLLLRELRETVVMKEQERFDCEGDIDFDFIRIFSNSHPIEGSKRYDVCKTKVGTAQYMLWASIQQVFKLLALDDYKDCAKFHTFLYEQLTLALNDWFPRATSLESSSCFPPVHQPNHDFPPSFDSIRGPGMLPPGPPPIISDATPHAFNFVPSVVPSMQSPGPIPSISSFHQQEIGMSTGTSIIPTKVEGRQRVALHSTLRKVLLDHEATLRRDYACKTTVADIELCSPQKDCALDSFFCRIRDVYGSNFLKELLEV